MKKRIVYLIMAGMLTLTGCSGLSSLGLGGEEAETAEVEDADDADVSDDGTASEDDADASGAEQGGEAELDFIPSSFVEINAGTDQFKDYNDIISHLKKGEGYAYIKVKGYDGDLLAITETVKAENNENHSIDVAIYGEKDGQIKCFGCAIGLEEKYPVAVGDGMVYVCSTDAYECLFMNPDGDGLMVKDDISKADDSSYVGFLRETNSYDDAETKDFEGGEKEFKEYFKNYEAATPINFTVVE